MRANGMGSRTADSEEVRSFAKDGRAWCKLGLVVAPAGNGSHFEKVTDANGNVIDVTVEVQIAHTGETMSCRLGSNAGRLQGLGIWCVPPPGTEVAIIIPEGELEAGPIIVATLSSGAIPSSLDDTTLVISHNAKVRIETSGDVEISAGGKVKLQGGDQPVARKTDPVDLGTLAFNPGTGGATLTWVPPGSSDPPTTIAPSGTPLTGKVKDGSSKTSSG